MWEAIKNFIGLGAAATRRKRSPEPNGLNKAGYYLGLKSGGGKNGHHKRSANPAGVQNTWEGIKKDAKETWEAIKNFIGLGAAATRRKRSPEPNGLNKAGYYLGLKSG